MIFDYYAALHPDAPKSMREARAQEYRIETTDLVGGFVDDCLLSAYSKEPDPDEKRREKNKSDARNRYMKKASEAETLEFPDYLDFEPDFGDLPSKEWIGIKVEFALEQPWYSKDDRPFHVLDNPVRKDRVFGVPFISGSTWKGLLRWACRMKDGKLKKHLKEHNMQTEGWEEPDWILHLFGNEKGETQPEKFHRGALVFYPTWFSKVGFEVINPHSRETRAGKGPIFYEVVPEGTDGALRILYAPPPNSRDEVEPADAVSNLIDAIHDLLTEYGMSAKRTAGWGTARVETWSAQMKDREPITGKTETEFKQKLSEWLPRSKTVGDKR